MTTSRVVGSVLMAAALASCGSNPEPAEPLTPSALATKIGCWADTGGKPGMYADLAATCGNPCTNHYAEISTFAGTKERDLWLARMDGAGVTVVGDRWAVSVYDVDMAKMVKSKLGGEIRHAERSGAPQIPGCQ